MLANNVSSAEHPCMERLLKRLRLHPELSRWWFLYAAFYSLVVAAIIAGYSPWNVSQGVGKVLLSAAMGICFAAIVSERRHGPQVPPPSPRAILLFAVATTVMAGFYALGASGVFAVWLSLGSAWLVDVAIDSLARHDFQPPARGPGL